MRRRDFLKAAGLAAVSLPLALPAAAFAETAAEGTFARPATVLSAGRWAMVIDTRKMASPAMQRKVITACHAWHNVPSFTGPQEVKWLWGAAYAAAFPEQALDPPPEALASRSFLLLCNHCENPPCVRVCPTGATFKRDDGIVVMDYHRCIGCRSCMAGCPYGARSFNFTDPRPGVPSPNLEYPMRASGVVEKCTFCAERLQRGALPLCVEASEGGILFGDLLDAASPVRKALEAGLALRRKPGLGTGPGVYYIL
ncbi:MAG: 4Fe-4S dicluster domain-containing protein [Deltaproteobacteria bacterium]|nr:4Fe-4S dicluster domain-containing protein [Deltaproteobacteria bacterium]